MDGDKQGIPPVRHLLTVDGDKQGIPPVRHLQSVDGDKQGHTLCKTSVNCGWG